MVTVLFFYNILIMIAFTFCCVGFLNLYIKHRDKSQLMIAFVFFLFIFDNLLLYMYEFLPSFIQGYARHVLVYRYATNLLCFFIIFTYRMTILSLEKKALSSYEVFLWVTLFIAVLATTSLSQSPATTVAQIVVLGLPSIGVFVHALFKQRKAGGFQKRKFVPNIGPVFLWISVFLEVLCSVESILALGGKYLLAHDRQLSIELLSVFYSVASILFLLKNRLRLDKEPVKQQENDDEEVLIASFCEAYMLTQREREILKLLLEGGSNADICKAAFISEGTVKTHTHNIYSKLNVKNRVQLGLKLKEFQKSGIRK